ncbi:DUF3667 domain-containing protein [Algoriphagus marinus]|uniref:DUF3667 domain-containing protein n=1 Tax=Algoriphagus marinus TaxID=1925762 RepID=UPI00094BA8B1|nr:DUF3667 domain-containing protein [Algoriphagus marinus]
MDCKNCGSSVTGNYCSNCGQASKVTKINLPNFLNELSESIFQVNRGFFHTIWALFFRPGNTIREFLDGKRKNYYKPIPFVLVLSTVYFLISQLAEQNTLIEDVISGFFAYKATEGSELPASLQWFSANYAYTTLLLIPIFSLASQLAFFGFRRNYLEHIVLNAYITGQQAVLYSIFISLEIFITSDILEVIPLFLSITYAFWVFWQFFDTGNRAVNILRSCLTYLFYLILSSGILAVIGDRLIG